MTATIGSLKWWTNCCVFGVRFACVYTFFFLSVIYDAECWTAYYHHSVHIIGTQMKGRKMEINMVIISTTAKDPIDCDCRQILKLNLKTINPLLKYCIFTSRDWRDVWPYVVRPYVIFHLSSLILFSSSHYFLFLCDFWFVCGGFVVFISENNVLTIENLNQTPNTLYAICTKSNLLYGFVV